MWKIALAVASGFLVTLLIFAVGREIAFAFQARPAGLVIGDALSAVGSLAWFDTTLVGGIIAVGAAYLSIGAVHQQVNQTAEIENNRIASRRAAVRATLGLALSSISDYATQCARLNHDLLLTFQDNRLPEGLVLPDYPPVPEGSVSTIQEMIEFAEETDRWALARIGPAIQVQSARLRGMEHDMETGSRPSRNNLLDYITDALEIYARCAALFDYSRDIKNSTARSLVPGDIVRSIHNIRLFSRLDEDMRRYAVAREQHLARNGQL